jgi:hypothetical protein
MTEEPAVEESLVNVDVLDGDPDVHDGAFDVTLSEAAVEGATGKPEAVSWAEESKTFETFFSRNSRANCTSSIRCQGAKRQKLTDEARIP